VILATLCASVLALAQAGQVTAVTGLRVEYQPRPLGLDVVAPRLSWRLEASGRGVTQSAWQIEVAAGADDLRRGRNLVWESGRVAGTQSLLVPYSGSKLRSETRYWWRVRVWDQDGRATPWSDPSWWEMGLLDPQDWSARWIEPGFPGDTMPALPAPMLRGAFTLDAPVARARLYITSHGLHEPWLNGRRVGDRLFTPGWTSYRHRLQVETYDVTAMLRRGPNVLGAVLGDGWYRSRLGWVSSRNIYGSRLALLAQLVITYRDGRTVTVGTDTTWRAATGPILASTIYDGERYDARLERDGWSTPGFDAKDWTPVRPGAADSAARLVAPVGPPVRRTGELTPVRIFRTPAGRTVADLGQNMVGWVRLRVRGPAGTTVTLRHAEVLDSAGEFYTANLRDAQAMVQYTLKGGGDEVFEPHFTFMGFRYVAVEGYPGEVAPAAITGIVIHSDMARTGRFDVSDSLLTQLQSNITWGQRGNFLDVPTDTPARDERLGWTGDAQAFSPTAAFNFRVDGFFSKWLADLAADQRADGAVPWVVPDVVSRAGAAGWGDVATIAPWQMYLAYGDTGFLARQFDSMRRWVDFIRGRAGDDLIWSEDPAFGDWLAFNSTSADYPGATTDKDLLGTAFFAHSADLVARAAVVLGRDAQAQEYRELFERIRAAYQREYLTGTGRLASNTQTAYALTLAFGLAPDALRTGLGRRLADDVQRFGHLTTGFLGTPHLLFALSGTGHLDQAYRLLLRKQYPSWLYPVTRGATTVWERWDGVRPDGSFQDTSMNSFNHYAYGAVGEWMYRVLAGLNLDPAEPGYRHVIVAPHPGGGLAHARAELETGYGPAASGWRVAGDTMEVTAVIPPNARGTVRLPGARLGDVTEGGVAVRAVPGVRTAVQDGDLVALEVGSGRYVFRYHRGARP
jgi:alpha-L-rhamnosidase